LTKQRQSKEKNLTTTSRCSSCCRSCCQMRLVCKWENTFWLWTWCMKMAYLIQTYLIQREIHRRVL